MKNFFYF